MQFGFEPLSGGPLFLPCAPDFFKLSLQVTHGLIHQQLLECPFLDVPRLVLFEVVDILHRAAEYRPLGFLARAVWYDAAELIYSIVNVASPPTLDLFLEKRSTTELRRR